MKKRMFAALALPAAAALLWAMPPVRAESAPLQEELYYLPAEVVDTQDGQTRFAQIDAEDPTLYIYTVPGIFPDHIPYLLTMDTQGTDSPADDTVLVVWGCMSGADPSSPVQP